MTRDSSALWALPSVGALPLWMALLLTFYALALILASSYVLPRLGACDRLRRVVAAGSLSAAVALLAPVVIFVPAVRDFVVGLPRAIDVSTLTTATIDDLSRGVRFAKGALIVAGLPLLPAVLVVASARRRSRALTPSAAASPPPAAPARPRRPEPWPTPSISEPSTQFEPDVSATLEVIRPLAQRLAPLVLTQGCAIGRDAARCELALPDQRVSQLHAELLPDAQGGWALRCLSEKGVLVDGSRLGSDETMELRSDMRISLGASLLRFAAPPVARPQERTEIMSPIPEARRAILCPITEAGEVRGLILPLLKLRSSIGRDAACDLQIPGQRVTSRHASIEYDGRYWLTDEQSTNGTYLGAERLSGRAPLQHGQEIRFADQRYRFELEGASDDTQG